MHVWSAKRHQKSWCEYDATWHTFKNRNAETSCRYSRHPACRCHKAFTFWQRAVRKTQSPYGDFGETTFGGVLGELQRPGRCGHPPWRLKSSKLMWSAEKITSCQKKTHAEFKHRFLSPRCPGSEKTLMCGSPNHLFLYVRRLGLKSYKSPNAGRKRRKQFVAVERRR